MVISKYVLRLRALEGYNKSPRRYRWGLRLRASSPRLRGTWFFGRGGLLNLLFYVRDAGERAYVDLVVVSLEPLLALALSTASAQERAQVTSQDAQKNREQRRVHKREDGVYGYDRGQRRLRVRPGHHVGTQDDQDDAGDQA